MRRVAGISILIVILTTGVALADTSWNGTLKLGGIFTDETGDRTAVQETYNIFNGFSLAQILVNGRISPRNYLSLNLRQINLNSRKANFLWRIPNKFEFSSHYDQMRWIFDPEATVDSERKDWQANLNWKTNKSFRLMADFNYQNRTGDRLGYPPGTVSNLGDQYDWKLYVTGIEGEYNRNRNIVALSYDFSNYRDDLYPDQERNAHYLQARYHTPGPIYGDKVSHSFRGAYGLRELANYDYNIEIWLLAYTGVFRLPRNFQLKYNFDYTYHKDNSTGLITDDMLNDFDLTYFYPYGRLFAGYGYEFRDDRALTHYNVYRVGGTYKWQNKLSAKVDYANRQKDDQEQATLLKDIETVRTRATIKYRHNDMFTVGAGYLERNRDYPDIGTKADGSRANIFGTLDYKEWGGLYVDYAYSLEEYSNPAGSFDVDYNIVTGRIDFERVENLLLWFGASYLRIKKNLNIEKSILYFGGTYTLFEDYLVELKYNVYNYDDFMISSRYFTGNYVWFNVGYNFDWD